MAANNRSKYGSSTKQSRKQKGKTYKINGARYRLVPRSDGRYNIVQEGRQGVAGSTPIITAKNYQAAINVMRKTVEEIDRENAQQEPTSKTETVSAEDYEASTEDVDSEQSTKVEEAEQDSEVETTSKKTPDVVQEEQGPIGRTLSGTRARAAGWRMRGLSKREELGTKVMKSGLKDVQKELSTIARAGGGPNLLDKAASFGAKVVSSKANESLREASNDFKELDAPLVRGRYDVAKKANAEAIRYAKKEGYEKLEVEKAEIMERHAAATTPEDKAKAEMEMKDWREKKALFDKQVPENVELPYAKLPKSVGKINTAKKRRKFDVVMEPWIVEENRTTGRYKKQTKVLNKSNKKQEKIVKRNKELENV